MSQPDPALLSAAEELAGRLRHHVSVLSSPAPVPADVVAAADAVGISAENYSNRVFDLYGWGSPFTPPPDSEDDFGPAEDGTDGAAAQVRVRAEYVIEVTSEHDLRRLATSRGLQVEQPASGEQSTSVDLVAALFQADGWKLDSYGSDVVQGLLASWSVEPMGGAADPIK